MAAAISLRMFLGLILAPVVAASSGDTISNSLFGGISPILALFGQDFATHYLSQSTSWLDTIVFAMGPLGIPATITAAIRVGGYGFLKGFIGRAGEKQASMEVNLLSSTSSQVCELWDGNKVVRLEAEKAPIRELIYFGGKWHKLSEAANRVLRRSIDKNTEKQESSPVDEESQMIVKRRPKRNVWAKSTSTAKAKPSPDLDPPNLSLNLIPEHRSWELYPAATLGILLQLTVLIIAGLTTLYPHWDGEFSILQYEFYCMAGGTVLLTFGLIVCASVVEQRTEKEIYETGNREDMNIVWLQRGRSDSDQSFEPYILGVKRKTIRTSRFPQEDPSASFKVWTLVGILAAILGYIIQFIGLSGMHWPTQAAQFTVTLIMTGIRAFIRRAPRQPSLLQRMRDITYKGDNHEMDWLTNYFGKEPKTGEGLWQMMTSESLSSFQERLDDVENTAQQTVLDNRCEFGRLCEWAGPGRKWAISLATAIDGVMDILSSDDLKRPFTWPLDIKVNKRPCRICFDIENDGRWKSNFTQIEGALSLGLFGDEFLEHEYEPSQVQDSGNPNDKADSKKDWLRMDEKMEKKEQSITLLGPNTPLALRNLMWWLGPQNGKLKELSLLKDTNTDILKFEQQRPPGFAKLVSKNEDDISIKRHRIAGFRSSSQTVSNSELGQEIVDSFTDQSRCLAAVSEADTGLLYARHMFSAFMWTIAAHKVKGFSNARIEKKQEFIPSEEKSWESLELSDKIFQKLAQCVQEAGLGDMEDAYLSVIPPLSHHQKLPKLVELFEIAQERAIQEQTQGNWDHAYNAYRLLFRNFVTFRECDEMVVRATALLTEFFMFLSVATKLREDQAIEWDEYEDKEVRKLRDLKVKVYNDLKNADGELVSHFATIYAAQGWSEVQIEFPCADRRGAIGPFDPQNVFKLTQLHHAAMTGDWIAMDDSLSEEEPTARDLFGRTALHYAAFKRPGILTASRYVPGMSEPDGYYEHFLTATRSLLKELKDTDARDCYGMTALHAAAQAGNAGMAKVLMENGASKDEKFQNRTALHIAAERGHANVVHSLIAAGADITMITDGKTDKRTALELAVLGSHIVVVFGLLEEEGSYRVDGAGRTALHLAAGRGVEGIVSLLLKKEAFVKAVEVKDTQGWTALHVAAENGHEEIVSLLLEHNADINAKGRDECTPLHLAARYGKAEVVEVLLSENADIDAEENTEIDVEENADIDVEKNADIVVEENADIDVKENADIDVEEIADIDAEENAGITAKKKADINAKDFDRWTPLHYAASYGHVEVVLLLLAAKAATEEKTLLDERTPLHISAGFGTKEVAGALLQGNAKVNARDLYGYTPLYLAVVNEKEPVIDVLLKYGADIDAEPDSGDETPLKRAKKKGFKKIVDLIESHRKRSEPKLQLASTDTPIPL